MRDLPRKGRKGAKVIIRQSFAKNIFVSLLFFLIVFCLDQFSKLYIQSQFEFGQSHSTLIPGVFITHHGNTGGAFGLGREYPQLFILISIIFLILGTLWLIISLKKSERMDLFHIAFVFILGGAAGNALDRIRVSYVVDFIDLKFWPIFNVADSFICIGAFLMILSARPKRKVSI